MNFCSKVIIQSLPVDTTIDSNCKVQTSNLGLSISNNTILPSIFNMSKGVVNTLSTHFLNCPDGMAPTLKTYWVLNSVDSSGWEQPIDRYCFTPRASNELQIAANDLTFGSYVLTAYAIDSNDERNFAALANYQVHVVSSSLSVDLNSGQSFVELNWDESLLLDFYENSYDPDLDDRTNKNGMVFYLVCTSSDSLSDSVRSQIMSLNLNGLSQELNLTFQRSDWLYFYENDCFFE